MSVDGDSSAPIDDDAPRAPPAGLSDAEYKRWEKTENKRLADAKKEKARMEKADAQRRAKWEKQEEKRAKEVRVP